MALFLLLPTRGEGANRYRGSYPTRVRHVSAGTTGLHVELCNGFRLWAAPGFAPAELPKLKDDFADVLAEAPAMTAEQYAALREAAELARPGCTETERESARAMAAAIVNDSHLAKRNAKARQAALLAEDSPRVAFDPAKPYRVYNRGPWGQTCFDFATLHAAREYLREQAERRAFMVSGAAPAGPHGDSIDPLASFIVWPDGTQTLAEMGWSPLAGEGRLWGRVEHSEGPAESEAAPAPVLIAETARARYWRTQAGFVSTLPGAELTADTGAGYARLDALMRLKGESAETIDSTLRAEVLRLEQAGKAAERETGRTVDLTPTWAGLFPVFRALIENGNAEGRRTAWAELARMAALADERNRMAERIEAAAELARGTRGGFDPASNGRAAIDAILSALAGAETISSKESGE